MGQRDDGAIRFDRTDLCASILGSFQSPLSLAFGGILLMMLGLYFLFGRHRCGRSYAFHGNVSWNNRGGRAGHPDLVAAGILGAEWVHVQHWPANLISRDVEFLKT